MKDGKAPKWPKVIFFMVQKHRQLFKGAEPMKDGKAPNRPKVGSDTVP